MIRERYEQFDVLKFWAILWVVIGHFADYRSSSGLFQSVFLFAYSWHMPLFILLAGLFDRPRDAFPGGKVASYVVLGLLFKLVAFFVDLLLGYRSFWLLGDAGAPWFMFAIAGWIALAWLFRRMPFLPVLAASLVLSLAVGYDNGVGDYLYLSRIVALFPIYWVGFKLSSGDVLKTMQRSWILIVSVFLLAGWGVACLVEAEAIQFLRPMFTWRNPYSVLEMGGGMFWRVVAYAVAGLLTAAHLGVFLNLKLPAFFSEIGKRTLSVYFWHTPAITILVASGFYNTLFYVGPVGKLALLFIGALMCWLFSRDLFMRPLERVRASIGATIECKTL